MTCTRAQEFLAKNEIETMQQVDAKKATMGAEAALALAATVDEKVAELMPRFPVAAEA